MEENILITLENDIKVNITPKTDLYELIITLKNKGVKIISEDPDDSIISRIIYEKVLTFYNNEYCRGDTLNTYNSTFGKDNNWRLLDILEKENISVNYRKVLLQKIEKFKHLYHSIGNFTALERWHKRGEVPCINGARGSFYGKIRDSWPLTLLCIQDNISDYSKLENNPLKYNFENNLDTKCFFKKYKNVVNGFEIFCDDHYFTPNLYGNNLEYIYVYKNYYGEYEINFDLFDGLSINKPLPTNVNEIEQYVERASIKIIERGKIILKEYTKSANVT